MKSIGGLIDYIDKNHDTKRVRYSLYGILAFCFITATIILLDLPSHEGYCKTAVDNYTCNQYKGIKQC